MRIINLAEDTDGVCGLIPEHGFCLYIETDQHKTLVDTGASDTTWQNAEKLGIDISSVDTVLLSHGHYDHTGGLVSFLKQNSNANIYIHKDAKGAFYNVRNGGEKYIGMAQELFQEKRIQWLSKGFQLNDEWDMLSGISGRRYWPQGNRILQVKTKNGFQQDSFSHEMAFVCHYEKEHILISGCAHNGILNILDAYYEKYGAYPTIVISGFHMMKQGEYTEEERQLILDTAKELKQIPTRFYSGHCTGESAFFLLKSVMGEQLSYLHCGNSVVIEK